MKCPSCGKESNGNFCPFCGKPIQQSHVSDSTLHESSDETYLHSQVPILDLNTLAFCGVTIFTLWVMFLSNWFSLYGESASVWLFGLIGLLRGLSVSDYSIFFNATLTILQIATFIAIFAQIRAIYGCLTKSSQLHIYQPNAATCNVILAVLGLIITFLIDIVYDGLYSTFFIGSVFPIVLFVMSLIQYRFMPYDADQIQKALVYEVKQIQDFISSYNTQSKK